VELGLRAAMHLDLCRALEQLLNDPSLAIAHDQGLPGEKCHRNRDKEMNTIFGPVLLKRNYYYRDTEQPGRAPLDEALGLVNADSPGLVRMMCRVGARQAFEGGAQDLRALAGVSVDGRHIQRVVNLVGPMVQETLQPKELTVGLKDRIPIFYCAMDGTGVPMVPKELEGREGKQEDGSAKTCEIKVGALFTQTKTDEEGLPMRDYESTSYLVSFQTASDYGIALRKEAFRRGMDRAETVVFLGDGAHGIWNVAEKNFPFAVHILDLYHALVHLETLAKDLYGENAAAIALAKIRWRDWLDTDQVQFVIDETTLLASALSDPQKEKALKGIAYVENNKHRMLYGTYRKMGLFYGSGVVEAGCRTVIGQRLKESGMFWTKSGALNVAVLRCALLDNRFDKFWDLHNHTDRPGMHLIPKAA
jgi:hypothetical protein